MPCASEPQSDWEFAVYEKRRPQQWRSPLQNRLGKGTAVGDFYKVTWVGKL